ncbi:hypothetical protein EFK50_13615 [Nocardioides marmoriginsengisoli]|uniref:Uncharacterized protein n=1 Tax=Nocardioides marmoriginsengisoli TaxID=661483 RepID=A0A3N0CH53_9ACTN|nr:hypothetical protein [Nocardioides marmoriginsengisoli]RNL62780.1 hypothetical protein EFK50_13615 [Nocardioides marmoriginsengisoli]
MMVQFVERLRHGRPELSEEGALLLITAATAALAAPFVTSSSGLRSALARDLADSAYAMLQARVPSPDSSSRHHVDPAAVDGGSRKDELLRLAVGTSREAPGRSRTGTDYLMILPGYQRELDANTLG